MLKQTLFVTLNAVIAFAISAGLFFGVFQHSENAIVHSIFQGGYLVILLMMIFIMLCVFIVERYFSLYSVAKGKSSVQVFFKKVVTLIQGDDLDGALAACDKQRGTTANVLRAGLERYREVVGSSNYDSEKKIALSSLSL